MAVRDAHPETPFPDLQFEEFKNDPLAVIRRVYGYLVDLRAIRGYRNGSLQRLQGRAHQPDAGRRLRIWRRRNPCQLVARNRSREVQPCASTRPRQATAN
jgi:hypothetical protein